MLRIPVERSVFPRVKANGKMSTGVIRVPQAASIRHQLSGTVSKRPRLRPKFKITSKPVTPPSLPQMNGLRFWRLFRVSPFVSNSTIPQTITKLGWASIQRAQAIRIMGRLLGGNSSEMLMSTTYPCQTGSWPLAIGAYVSFQTADTRWSNEKNLPSTRRIKSTQARRYHQRGNRLKFWKPWPRNPFVSGSTTLQPTTMLGSASTRQTQATKTMERKTTDGNGFATSMSTTCRSPSGQQALEHTGVLQRRARPPRTERLRCQAV